VLINSSSIRPRSKRPGPPARLPAPGAVQPKGSAELRLGVDTGGTFTDFVRLGPDGLRVHKIRSTPEDPSRAILEGIGELCAEARRAKVTHGSTVATNAILERKGARVALLTTAGFEDVLAIGRQTRPELYNLFVLLRRPLVERERIFGVRERLDASGAVIEALDQRAVTRVARRLRGSVDIVVVCFLHSYANPAHERQALNCIRRAGLAACGSHEVLPEYREYERWATTVLNAYVTPLMDRYLGRLEEGLGTGGLSVMQSNGGAISGTTARKQAIRTVLSGPAAGVVGARAVAQAAGFNRVLTFDMGGTSTDVSLVDGEISLTTESVIGDFPVRLPMIDVHTVGAGGGSLVTLDAGGALRVGPQSAGADPGPACYGRGSQLTVTDANLLLGRLDQSYFLGGRMTLDSQRPLKLAQRLAARLRVSVPELAEGIVRVANSGMERAMRVVSVERGHDPRDFALLAFGGAGGEHACEIAEQLEIGTIIVPRYAGVLSALGMLMADVTKDYSASLLRRSDTLRSRDLLARLKPLAEEARCELRAEGFPTGRQVIERLIDVRYVGQSSEITLPFSPDYRHQFDLLHLHRYGYCDPLRPTEVVNLRVKASGITDKPNLPYTNPRPAQAEPVTVRPAWFGGRQWPTAYYRWDNLSPGSHARGPAVIAGGEATIVVPPQFGFRLDGFGNVIIRPTRAATARAKSRTVN